MQLALALLAFVTLVVPASAQQVVFQDGFENGLTNWTATGLWHQSDSLTGCGSLAAPFPEARYAARYGRTGPCDYATGAQYNSGFLELNPIQLPDAPSISLHFESRSETEYCTASGFPLYEIYDQHLLIINGSTGVWLCPDNPTGVGSALPWHAWRVDLSAYRGTTVQLGFYFDTYDDVANWGLGWLIDDVRILAEPGQRVCPGTAFNHGCPSPPWYLPVSGGCQNSTGDSAVMYTSGSVSVASDSLQVRAENLPPSSWAMLVQATASTAVVPFGAGLTCTGGTLRRLGIVPASSGIATWPIAGAPPISQQGGIAAGGGTRYYCVFYRDAPGFMAPPTNATDVQRIQWLP